MSAAGGPDLLARIAFSAAVEPGNSRFAALLARTAFSAAALAEAPERWLSEHELKRFDLDGAGRALRRARDAGVVPIVPGDEHWPDRLDELEALPIMLWARGDASLLSAPSVAITGARACTGYGAFVTTELAEHVAQHGLAVVSGAAYGIDAAAHRAALAVGRPTVAVLAGGVDRSCPAGHDRLFESIAESGLAVSEAPPGTAPTRLRFMQHQRLVAALSDAVVIPEAGARSGALRTAGFTHGMGWPVGAVPGPVTSAASAGCHLLVQEGTARLITSGEDVMHVLGQEGAQT